MYRTLECITVRKFGLNKSGHLISIAEDQYSIFLLDRLEKDKTKVHIVSLQIIGGRGAKPPQPLPHLPIPPPFLEQPHLSHSFTPFLKISTWSSPPHLSASGENFQPPSSKRQGVWTVICYTSCIEWPKGVVFCI